MELLVLLMTVTVVLRLVAADYDLTIETAGTAEADTGSRVMFRIHGTMPGGGRITSPETTIQESQGDFAVGTNNTYRVTGDYGKPRAIDLGMDNSFPSDWHVERVWLKNLDTNEVSQFTCRCWIEEGQGLRYMTADVDGGFSEWTVWSPCAGQCGSGFRFRRRECNNPAPSGQGADCDGPTVETGPCVPGTCVQPTSTSSVVSSSETITPTTTSQTTSSETISQTSVVSSSEPTSVVSSSEPTSVVSSSEPTSVVSSSESTSVVSSSESSQTTQSSDVVQSSSPTSVIQTSLDASSDPIDPTIIDSSLTDDLGSSDFSGFSSDFCSVDHFLCTEGYSCIHWTLLCDGQEDCEGGQDETDESCDKEFWVSMAIPISCVLAAIAAIIVGIVAAWLYMVAAMGASGAAGAAGGPLAMAVSSDPLIAGEAPTSGGLPGNPVHSSIVA